MKHPAPDAAARAHINDSKKCVKIQITTEINDCSNVRSFQGGGMKRNQVVVSAEYAYGVFSEFVDIFREISG
jgi:hypothetical protein